jgi:biotin carboxyl carrier protein
MSGPQRTSRSCRPARPTEEDWQLAAALFAGPPGWRSDSVASFDLTLACGKENRRVGAHATAIDWDVDANGHLRYTRDGITRQAIIHRDGDTLYFAHDAAVFVFREASPLPVAEKRHDPAIARASVAGTVARLEVGAGDTVIAGQTLAVIEAMKMEMRVTAGANGTVAACAYWPAHKSRPARYWSNWTSRNRHEPTTKPS